MSQTLSLHESKSGFKHLVWTLLHDRIHPENITVQCVKRTFAFLRKSKNESGPTTTNTVSQMLLENCFLHFLCNQFTLSPKQERAAIQSLLFQQGRTVEEVSWILAKPIAAVHSQITKLFQG